MTPILILAAGASRRMRGADKLLEDVEGQPLLQRVAARAIATGHPVFVALPGPQHPRYDALRHMNVICFDVPDAREGMAGTLRGGVKRLPPCSAFMILLSDLPEIETADMNAVFAAREQQPGHLIWRGATQDGKPGHPILFSGTLRPEFEKLSGDTGGESLVNPLQDRTVLVPLSGHRARLDLDTPEEWAAWRENRQARMR